MILRRFQIATAAYPRQFWLMFWGLLISVTGSSMIWPFLMIYVSERLGMPMTATASLMTLNAAMGLIFSFVAGQAADHIGRKAVMVISLGMNGLVYFLYSSATTLPLFALAMALAGAFNPLYRVGADAMMADLIEPAKRADAYSLLRLGNNVGVALGPAIGGFIATRSYSITFYIAATGMLVYGLMVLIFGRETLPKFDRNDVLPANQASGYRGILRDRGFMSFVGAVTLNQICSATLWILLAVYAKQNYGVPESMYGWIPTTNAVMVVFLQLYVTARTKTYPPLWVMAVGALFYAVGVGSVALGRGFGGFWLSMVIATIGELIIVPTATTYAANSAPPESRGRYMSIFGLSWMIASGVGPVFGGLLNDHFGPAWIWVGGGLVGMLATVSFILLSRGHRQPEQTIAEPAPYGRSD